ncbi:MAG: hypothetical protein GY786_09100 [Proteobacteria bacterium]|nr:hypothetical protein [Pseudomonadota bacterium]
MIIDAQAFGDGTEQPTLKPITEKIKDRFQHLGVSENIYEEGAIVTADTGFSCEENMQYMHENGIDGFIPDIEL